MTYNLTGIGDNITGLLSFTQGVNNVLMFGHLGHIFLVVIFSISLITFLLSTDEAGKSLIASSFTTFVCAILLLAVDLINPLGLYIPLIILAGSVALNIKR